MNKTISENTRREFSVKKTVDGHKLEEQVNNTPKLGKDYFYGKVNKPPHLVNIDKEDVNKLLEKYVCRGGTKKCPVPHEPILEGLTYRKLKKLLSLVKEEGYVQGYKDGSGDLGKRTASEYVGFNKKLEEAKEEGRREGLQELIVEVEEYFGHIGNDGVTGKPIKISQKEIAKDVLSLIKSKRRGE